MKKRVKINFESINNGKYSIIPKKLICESNTRIKNRMKFINDKNRLKNYIDPNEKELDYFFEKSISFFEQLNLGYFTFSLTASKSISFRLFKNKYEIAFEVFYTKDDKNDDIEVVYTIYNNKIKEINNFGSLKDSIIKIKTHIEKI